VAGDLRVGSGLRPIGAAVSTGNDVRMTDQTSDTSDTSDPEDSQGSDRPPGWATPPAGGPPPPPPPARDDVPPPPPPPGHSPPLRRSANDRYVAGVCGGLGRYFDIDPVIFRIAFPVLAIFAGVGVLLYALGWLLVPEEGTDETEGQRLFSGRGTAGTVFAAVAVVLGSIVFLAWIGDGPGPPAIVLLAVVALLVIIANRRPGRYAGPGHVPAGHTVSAMSAVAPPPPYGAPPADRPPPPPYTSPQFGPPGPPGPPWHTVPTPVMPPPPPPPPRERSPLPLLTVSVAALVAGALVLVGLDPEIEVTAGVIVASVLVVVGIGLVVGAWFGRARSLIAAGVAAVLALVAVATYDVPLRGGFGDRVWAPASAEELDSPYRLGAGSARLDLTEMASPGRPLDVEASIGAGELVAIVPESADLQVTAEAGLGQVDLPNGASDGLGATREYRYEGATAGLDSARLIRLDLQVGIGHVEVRRA
jgi:phage shock protein PspC (stress-responsive transcriptional regulator)